MNLGDASRGVTLPPYLDFGRCHIDAQCLTRSVPQRLGIDGIRTDHVSYTFPDGSRLFSAN